MGAEKLVLTTLHAAGFGTAAMLWGIAALTPAPERFWLWALALLADLATPWLVVHLTHKFPPDSEHLPERFGLFTIILLGESVAAVMRGMESQEAWPPSAAISAFTGLALVCALWWWYFDGVRGAGERHITSARQTALFQIWSYAHFPLYLSVAVVGIGVEHVISLSPGTRLHLEDAWILVGAASILMITLQIIGWTLKQGQPTPMWRALRLVLCFAALPAPLVVTVLPPCVLVVALTLLCGIQIKLATRGVLVPQNNLRGSAKLVANPGGIVKTEARAPETMLRAVLGVSRSAPSKNRKSAI